MHGIVAEGGERASFVQIHNFLVCTHTRLCKASTKWMTMGVSSLPPPRAYALFHCGRPWVMEEVSFRSMVRGCFERRSDPVVLQQKQP